MTETFVPGPDTSRAFRDALGCFSTGVCVVTALEKTGAPIGITANSFASVSLDPPLVLWSPAKASTRYGPFVDAEHFAIHIMAADQHDVASGFARVPDYFAETDWAPNEHGVPVLKGGLAHFECVRHAVHDGGDHSIVVGRVLLAAHAVGAPLLFARGQYGRFMGVK